MDKIETPTLSIDPGWGGGFALLPYSGVVEVFKMPQTPEAIHERMQRFRQEYPDGVVLLEKVGFHRKGNSASSSVKFAKNVAYLEMAAIANELPVNWLNPRKWMVGLLDSVPRDKGERKNAIKAAMQVAYPHIKVTLWNADALGMLEYGRQTFLSQNKPSV